MNEDDLEAAVMAFLERRALEPSLTPEAFVSGREGLGPGALEATRAALELEALFHGRGQAERQIGPYRIAGEIGRGGMGIVYRAERDGGSFALKLLPLAPILGPRMLERFRREAGALAQLSHPGIVGVHDSGMHEEVPYLVMDLVEGLPLHRQAGPMAAAEAARIVGALAETLAVAHRRGILHRDLKPQNVIVRPDGLPVLLDFGLSAAEDLPTLTATGEFLGTPRYMAPEQIRGGAVDARTDLYALGLILFELVTGRPARLETARDALLEEVRSGRIPRPRAVVPSVPADLEKIVLVCVAFDPRHRYADADALALDLKRFATGQPVAAHPPGRVSRAVQAVRALRVRDLFVARRAGPPPTDPPSDPSAARRAASHLDRALSRWLDGDPDGAYADLVEARRLDPGEPLARALAVHVMAEPGPLEDTAWLRDAREALRLLDAGAEAEAAVRVADRAGELPGSFAAAVAGLGAAARGDDRTALDELSAAARLLPSSARIQRALAEVCVRLERFEDGANAYRRAIDLAPGSAATWAGLADACLRQRDLEEGLRAITMAESLAGTADSGILRIRATLEVHAGRQDEARRLLSRLLEIHPDDVEARYEMAHSLDADHDLPGAELGYRRVLELTPRHVRALVGLAYLHAGASRGQCARCDAAFAAQPGLFDLGKAEQYLLRALDEDRGRSEAATYNLRDIALRLERRGAVIEMLERLTADSSHSPASLRLKDMLRRLHLTAPPTGA